MDPLKEGLRNPNYRSLKGTLRIPYGSLKGTLRKPSTRRLSGSRRASTQRPGMNWTGPGSTTLYHFFGGMLPQGSKGPNSQVFGFRIVVM